MNATRQFISMETVKKLTDSDAWRVVVLFILTMLFRYLVAILTLLVTFESIATAGDAKRNPFFDGEILQYRVRWGFFRLGTITLTQQRVIQDGRELYYCILKAESNPKLPFIDVFFVNSAFVDPDTLTSVGFVSELGRTGGHRFVHQWDKANRCITVTETRDDSLIRSECIPTRERIENELSMLLIMRMLAGSGETVTLHSVMEFKVTTTDVEFTRDKELIDIPAFDEPIRGWRFEGKANWTRKDYAGLKGEFRGWVSDDSAAVMLKSEMKIFLGSVVLELESYTRPGWDPVRRFVYSGQ